MTSIFCCLCNAYVPAERVTGADIYPHRPDLSAKKLWRCPECRGYVGCHPGTGTPLGVIPSPAIRGARSKIHAILDPIWKTERLSRKHVYARLTEAMGWQYHTGELRTLEEAREVYRAVLGIRRDLGMDGGAE